jgi:hypothetical protein
MKIADKKPVLNVAQLRALPEFGKLKRQQQKFLLLISAGATPIEAVRGAYNCKSRRSGERFLYDLMSRRTLQPVLKQLFGQDNKAEFMERLEKLLRRGPKVTEAEVKALILYGAMNDLLPPDYSGKV